MNCENCQSIHEGAYGSGRFCSSKCARGFATKNNRKEISAKVSQTLKVTSQNENFGFRDKTRFDSAIKSIHEAKIKRLETVLHGEFETVKSGWIKDRIMFEQEYKCNRCGLQEWMDLPITLELEHKDGNHHNNTRENLECLCPNCHSLTPTWRGRNKKATVSDEELMIALKEEGSIRQALLRVGMAAKGNNYIRAKKLIAVSE